MGHKTTSDVLKFSMGNTIVSFRDKYYEYGVDINPDRWGLTIGSFESAFLADLEASYIFDKLNCILERHVQFVGTYHSDKIIVFQGNRSNKWLRTGSTPSKAKSTNFWVHWISNSPWKSGNQIQPWDHYPTPMYLLKESVSSTASVWTVTNHSHT